VADNKHKGEVTIEIAGDSYQVAFTWDAVARLSSVFGNDFDGEVADAIKNADVKALSVILSLSMTPEQTPEWIMEQSPPIAIVGDAINRALTIAFLGPGLEKEPEGDKPENPLTGSLLPTMWQAGLGSLLGLGSRRRNSGASPPIS